MPYRRAHQEEVCCYLQQHFRIQDWNFSLPRGSGMETYFAEGNGQRYFAKVGAPIKRYLAMAEIGLTPPILAHGELVSGPSVMIQQLIDGKRPSSKDFCGQWERIVPLVHKMHNHIRAKEVLQTVSSIRCIDEGLQSLNL